MRWLKVKPPSSRKSEKAEGAQRSGRKHAHRPIPVDIRDSRGGVGPGERMRSRSEVKRTASFQTHARGETKKGLHLAETAVACAV